MSRHWDPTGRVSIREELLDAGVPAAEIDTLTTIARMLEDAALDDPAPSTDFTARVMAVIETEPDPRPASAATTAVRTPRPAVIVAALRSAWRAAVGPGRPLAMRAQGLALLFVAVVVVGAAGGSILAVGTVVLREAQVSPEPSPLVSPAPSTLPTPSPTPSPVVSPSPSPSPSPSIDATSTPETSGSEDNGGDSGGPTPGQAETPRPTETPHGTDTSHETPHPSDTPEPGSSDDH